MYKSQNYHFKMIKPACAVLALMTQPALANEKEILLESDDKALSITGEYISHNEEAYTIEHASLGKLRVAIVPTLNCFGEACPTLVAAGTVDDLTGDQVELRDASGSVSIKGALLGFEDSTYIIDSNQLGKLFVSSGDGITCTGAACPDLTVQPEPSEDANDTIAIGIAPGFSDLFMQLAVAYASDINGVVSSDDASDTLRILNEDGAIALSFRIAATDPEDQFAPLARGEVSHVLATSRLTATELSLLGLPDLRGTDSEVPLARDALVMVTNPANTLQSLSQSDIARLWSGEVTNWNQLGGPNQIIQVLSKEQDSRDLELLATKLLAPVGATPAAVKTLFDDQELIQALTGNKGAIALVRSSDLQRTRLKQLGYRAECGLVSQPTHVEVASGQYPLSRSLYLYQNANEMAPEMTAFLTWLSSTAGQEALAQSGMLDYKPPRLPLAMMGHQMIHTAAYEPDFDGQQFVRLTRELQNAERLAYDFRFESGSARLTALALDDITALAADVVAEDLGGGDLVLVGFTDSVGNAGNNTRLAMQRAEIVRNALGDAIASQGGRVPRIIVDSYGELMPLSCNDTSLGRDKNRRVEAWVRPTSG